MATVFRSVGAIVVGVLVAFGLVIAVEAFSAVVYPVPADFDGSMEQMCQHVANYPDWVLGVVVVAWGATALAGTWIAGRLANRGAALVVGLLLLAGVAFNVSMLPYPVWFKAVILITIPLAIGAALYWTSGRRAWPQ